LLPARLDRFTQRTITDRIKLMAQLHEIRKSGYCISRGEVSDQLVSVAVPVLAFDGSVIAALNIAAPAFRTQDSDLERFVSILKGASRKISEELNW
jgi:DNA-binding IclR family transcriptional regulator